jgi:class 3 adenylate cyclase
MTTVERDLKQSIEEALAGAAQRNEVRVARIRSFGLSIIAILGPQIMAPRTLRLALIWAAVSWVIVAVERHSKYRFWVPAATTALDAVMIASFTLVTAAGQPMMLASTALVCTILAITGALRMKRGWVVVTTLAAMANIALSAARNELLFAEGLLLCLLIGVAGVMGYFLTRISQRAFESEVNRVIASRFVPESVLDAGYQKPLSVLTEPRAIDATVLISDIRAFTKMAETLPPAEVLEFLNEVQGRFASIVEANGGTVDKFMGDGMLAVFGVRNEKDNHASGAIAAARELVAAAEELAVPIGIGVHSGRVVTGLIGNGSRLELTVVGDTVNIASRLEKLTREKQVVALISDSVVDRASNSSNPLQKLGAAEIRGRANEVVIYTLVAA